MNAQQFRPMGPLFGAIFASSRSRWKAFGRSLVINSMKAKKVSTWLLEMPKNDSIHTLKDPTHKLGPICKVLQIWKIQTC